jgi:hypothetical protein
MAVLSFRGTEETRRAQKPDERFHPPLICGYCHERIPDGEADSPHVAAVTARPAVFEIHPVHTACMRVLGVRRRGRLKNLSLTGRS